MNEEETKPKSEDEEPQNTKKQRLEALYKEYATRTKEIEFHSGRYHRQVGYVQTYLAAISSLASYIYLGRPDAAKPFMDGAHQFEIVMTLAFLTLFLFFLFVTMMDSLQMLMINGKYVATIEKRVNDEIGDKPMMRWENKVIPYFLGTSWSSANGWLKPQPLIFVAVLGLFGFAIFTLSYFCWKLAEDYKGVYIVSTVLTSVFLLYQWIKLLSIGSEFINDKAFEVCELESAATDKYDTDIVAFVIPVATVILGFGVFTASALQTNTYLAHQGSLFFGLLSIPSIYIGDLFLLPFINLGVYKAFRGALLDGEISKKNFLIAALVCLAVSVTAMCWVHDVWIHDKYLGFMDFKYGELSFAGWWHLGFSTFEFGLILLLLRFGAFNSDMRQKFLEIWSWVIGFSAISIADSFVRQYWIFDKTLFDSILTMLFSSEIFSMGSFFLAGLIYYVVKKIDDISKILPSLSRL